MNINVTLLAQIVAFVLMIWFVNRVLWGPLNRLLAERQKRVADGLAAAEKGRHDLELSERRARELLEQAHAQAATLIAQSERRATEIVEEAKEEARRQGERLIETAKGEIERETHRAREQLRAQVAALAAEGAAKIIKREIDRRTHDELMKDLVAQI
jgi:F-type H+-transporting ATPase subunit b